MALSVGGLIARLVESRKALEPPFLALPEEGWTPEVLAYRRGAHAAYGLVLEALAELSPEARAYLNRCVAGVDHGEGG